MSSTRKVYPAGIKESDDSWTWVKCECVYCKKVVAYNWRSRHVKREHPELIGTDLNELFKELLK